MHSHSFNLSSIEQILEIENARPIIIGEGISSNSYNLTLSYGEIALIKCHDIEEAQFFADICTGQIDLYSGSAKYLGLDWAEIDDKRINALRGMISRIDIDSGWVDFYPMHINILASALYHTNMSFDHMVNDVTKLCYKFGLPGLPTKFPNLMSHKDRKCSEYIRAFFNSPSLLLLINPINRLSENVYNTFLEELTAAQKRGCAIIWIDSDTSMWNDFVQDNMQFFILNDSGLIAVKDPNVPT